MKPQIRLSPEQFADFQEIRDIHPRDLDTAIEELKRLEAGPVSPRQIQSVLGNVLVSHPSGSEPLLRQALALHSLSAHLSLNSDAVFDSINLALLPIHSRWTEAEYQRWSAVAPKFREFHELEVVNLSSKALDLSYAHAELLRNARILTDIRPVFDKDANEIRGSVVAHTLLLRYDDVQGDHQLGLALDASDIRNLAKECERALKKSEVAKRQLSAIAHIPTIILGDEE